VWGEVCSVATSLHTAGIMIMSGIIVQMCMIFNTWCLKAVRGIYMCWKFCFCKRDMSNSSLQHTRPLPFALVETQRKAVTKIGHVERSSVIAVPVQNADYFKERKKIHTGHSLSITQKPSTEYTVASKENNRADWLIAYRRRGNRVTGDM
jgi:hypothetical protein